MQACQILDDEELEKQGKFRVWREESSQLAATRIFGGPREKPGVSVPGAVKPFPSAFRNVKTKSITNQKQTPSMPIYQALAAPVSVDISGQKQTYRGALFRSVRTMLGIDKDQDKDQDKDSWVADPERIAKEGVPLVKLDPLILPPELDFDPPYAACTPPGSPKA